MILQFGKTGQLAAVLQEQAAARKVALQALSRQDCDVTDPHAVEAAIAGSGAAMVLNAAAFSLVDKAEAHPDEAFAVNGAAPGVMARACAARGVPFVHVSTDHVFDGSGAAPRREDEPALPVNTYGRSKRRGEEAVLAAGGTALVVRTSWIFSGYGSNFIHIMLGLKDRPEIRVVDDQLARPTPTRDLANFLLDLEAKLTGRDAARYTGIVHYVGDSPVNRYDFARAVFEAAGLHPNIVAVPSSDFPTPAERPKNGVLDTTRLRTVFGTEPPDWRAALKEVVAGLEKTL